ncbi:MAG TPA: hypothetical protein VKW08_27840 [Xanthobacteraceae bacterium]|nr:hypothetical protein [Xanthobacteraceae bacterium]
MQSRGRIARSPARSLRIGIDFDNTLIGYDEVFCAAAQEHGLLDRGFIGTKQAVRDAIRLLPEGELAWQRLQGHVYGKAIGAAVMFDGVSAFLRRCRETQCEVFIVSHKTELGQHDPDRVNLRQAALGWMEARGFFAPDGCAVPRQNVFFEATRAEKLARIAALGCTHFIDDLAEVLADPAFPPGVTRVLFGSGGAAPDMAVCATWWEIAEVVFDE